MIFLQRVLQLQSVLLQRSVLCSPGPRQEPERMTDGSSSSPHKEARLTVFWPISAAYLPSPHSGVPSAIFKIHMSQMLYAGNSARENVKWISYGRLMPKWPEDRPCPLLSSYKGGNSICGEYSGILATLRLVFTLLLIIPSPHLRLATTAQLRLLSAADTRVMPRPGCDRG